VAERDATNSQRSIGDVGKRRTAKRAGRAQPQNPESEQRLKNLTSEFAFLIETSNLGDLRTRIAIGLGSVRSRRTGLGQFHRDATRIIVSKVVVGECSAVEVGEEAATVSTMAASIGELRTEKSAN
jgi:hypothetical protein